MSLKDFIIGKLLGKGVFGSVSLVTRKRDGNIYAMKRVNIGKLNKKVCFFNNEILKSTCKICTNIL